MLAKGCVRTARGVTHAGLQQNGLPAGNGLFLEPTGNRPRRDRLFREQIGGAQKNADLHPSIRQRSRHRRNHGRRHGVMNPAGKDDLVVARPVSSPIQMIQDHADHRVPKNEARSRADVPAALPPLENHPANAPAQKHLQQAGRGNVHVGRNPLTLKESGLIRSTTGDDGVRRRVLANLCKLLLA